jgi:CHAT domain-containing protein
MSTGSVGIRNRRYRGLCSGSVVAGSDLAAGDGRDLATVPWAGSAQAGCPTGLLDVLPWHAAGHYDSGPPGRSVLDRVISSYAATLESLRRARAAPTAHSGRPPRVLLVTMPAAPGAAPLPGVEQEARVVMQRFPERLHRAHWRSRTTTSVLAGIPGHTYAHFACHGGVNQFAPAESGLVLSAGWLTIGQLSGIRLPPGAARLAFLSACHTGSVGVTLPDESITMAAAVQLAGYQHVIASMWTIPDAIMHRVVRRFYTVLAQSNDRDPPVARALHTAIRDLRDAGFRPDQWAPYVHSGP